ncbi:MAG: hypothetical protein KIS89_02585 [Dokdonella sp.]|nr:hypothetical protein [Dokdonella sp.]
MSWQLRHALITGLSGQDGALLAAQLLARGIAVSGTHRPGRALDDWRACASSASPRHRHLAQRRARSDRCRRLRGHRAICNPTRCSIWLRV